MVFACSPHAYVGSHQVLWLPPTSQQRYVKFTGLYKWPIGGCVNELKSMKILTSTSKIRVGVRMCVSV